MFLPPFLFLFFLLFSKHFETETADFFLSEKRSCSSSYHRNKLDTTIGKRKNGNKENVTGQTTLCHAMFEEGDTLLAVIQKSFFYNKIKVASNSNKGAKKWAKKNRHRSLHYKR